MSLVSTLAERNNVRMPIAAAFSLGMGLMVWHSFHNPLAKSDAEMLFGKVLFWLNFPSVIVAIMLGGVHNYSPTVIAIGSAVQWFGIGYLFSMIFTRPKKPS